MEAVLDDMLEDQLVDLVGHGIVGQRPLQKAAERGRLDRAALLGSPAVALGAQPRRPLSPRASRSAGSGATATAQSRVGSSQAGTQR